MIPIIGDVVHTAGERVMRIRDLAGGPVSILIVEDEPEAAQLLSSLLTREGADVRWAKNGAEGLELLRGASEFSAVVLDRLMPGLTGDAVLQTIRSDPKLAAQPVIVVTGCDSPKERAELLNAGANDFISKPFDVAELLARLRAMIRELALRREMEKRAKELETALAEQRRLAAELQASAEALTQASKIKDHFISVASHDLRSPLTNVKGYAELLMHGALGEVTPDQTNALQIILKNCSHLLDILGKLLDVSRLDAGEFGLSLESRDLKDILSVCVASLLPNAMRKGISLKSPSTPPDFPTVVCDGDRIQCVFENLLSNAVKFGHSGDTVSIRAAVAEGNVEVRVTDTGPGIPEAEMPRLFDRFARLSVVPTGGEKSVGLGLSLAREIVRLHGGDITAESVVGKGTTFLVRLPIAGPSAVPPS